MQFGDICMLLSSVFDVLSFFLQLKRNKQRRSVHGLSFDFIVLTWLSYLSAIVCSVNYYINPQVIRQFRKRNPVHSELIISVPTILIDLTGLVLLSGIILQVFVVYNRTKNINQSFSYFNISFVGVILFIFFWLVRCCASSRGGWFLLDIVDYVWLASALFKMFRLFPQVSLSWFCCNVVGIDDNFLVYQWTSMTFLSFAKIGLSRSEWYQIPFNYNTWGYLLLYTFTLVIFTVQKKSIYHRERYTAKFDPHRITNINV